MKLSLSSFDTRQTIADWCLSKMEDPALLDVIPDDLLVMIFEQLSPLERLKISEVSSRLRDMMGDSRYWSHCRLASRFPLLIELSLDDAPIVEEIIAPIDAIENDVLRYMQLMSVHDERLSKPLMNLLMRAMIDVWCERETVDIFGLNGMMRSCDIVGPTGSTGPFFGPTGPF